MKGVRRRLDADICVLGAGAGGLSVAAGAARLGRRVVLFEPAAMGGECLNTGCVPSKAILAAAKHVAEARAAVRFGVSLGEPQVDFTAVMDHVRAAIAAIEPNDSQERFEGLGVTVVREAAAFIDPRTVASDSVEVRARRFVLATGSEAVAPPISGLADTPHLTTDTLWGLTALPERLIILGAGAAGVEMSQAFARLGSKVTLLEAGERVLPAAPEHASSAAQAALAADGVEVRVGARAAEIGRDGQGVKVVLQRADGIDTLTGSHLLLAAGRRPRTAGLGLDKAGVAVGPRGIENDARLRTSNRRVYVVGDAAGRVQLTHAAGWHASVVVRGALFRMPTDAGAAAMPFAVYTDPEIAWIGQTEAEALAKLGPKAVRATSWTFADNDRAIADGDTAGDVRLVASRRGKILGASVIGAGAGEIVQLVSLAMASGLTVRALASYIAPYPSRAEILKRAAGAWYEPVVFGPGARRLVGVLAKLP
ncbi:MAG: FAD-dependent oxidoreductase [Caulobacterales bacterium]|nr:FAD-dependent oxidoreductase [Caulobacterales bacterium]